jgi:pyruvate dehydrogenase (quinone)
MKPQRVIRDLNARLAPCADCELEQALSHPGPVLVDAVTDPNEPMLPPKRRDDYVKKLSKALDRGTPGRAEIEQRLPEEPAATSLRF